MHKKKKKKEKVRNGYPFFDIFYYQKESFSYNYM